MTPDAQLVEDRFKAKLRKEHTKFVFRQPCVVCGRAPADRHHLRFAQPRVLGQKVSDEYTVDATRPVCGIDRSDAGATGSH